MGKNLLNDSCLLFSRCKLKMYTYQFHSPNPHHTPLHLHSNPNCLNTSYPHQKICFWFAPRLLTIFIQVLINIQKVLMNKHYTTVNCNFVNGQTNKGWMDSSNFLHCQYINKDAQPIKHISENHHHHHNNSYNITLYFGKVHIYTT